MYYYSDLFLIIHFLQLRSLEWISSLINHLIFMVMEASGRQTYGNVSSRITLGFRLHNECLKVKSSVNVLSTRVAAEFKGGYWSMTTQSVDCLLRSLAGVSWRFKTRCWVKRPHGRLSFRPYGLCDLNLNLIRTCSWIKTKLNFLQQKETFETFLINFLINLASVSSIQFCVLAASLG